MATNPVVQLNEYCTKHDKKFSDSYTYTGPSNSRTFFCKITIEDISGEGEGKTKKDSKATAATNLLQNLNSTSDTRHTDTTMADISHSLASFRQLESIQPTSNAKGMLQEFCQKNELCMPSYTLLSKTGLSHQSEFNIRCSVNNMRSELVGEGLSTARSIKSAEADAAVQVYQYLRGQYGSFPIIECSGINETQNTSCTGEAGIVSVPHTKSRLQELCQRNSLLIPKYLIVSRTGPTHAPDFNVKCCIKDLNGDIIEEEFGYGKSLKSAEINAATKVTVKIQRLIDSMESGALGGVSPRFLSKSVRTGSAITTVVDPVEEDELVALLIAKNCLAPEYLFETTEPVDKNDPSTIQHLCLAYANVVQGFVARKCDYDVTSMPVIGQGTGDTQEEAKRDALITLICNVGALGVSS